MSRRVIYVVCAEGEDALAAHIADPLQKAGYEVAHNGTIAIGESLINEAEKAITSGSPIFAYHPVRDCKSYGQPLVISDNQRRYGVMASRWRRMRCLAKDASPATMASTIALCA